MSWVQDNWNNYYKDKQWIDTKGWCDLDGNPLPLGHDNVSRKNRLFRKRKRTYTYYSNRMYADKVSFLGTLLKYVFRLARLFFIWLAVSLVLTAANNEQAVQTVTTIFALIFLGLCIHFIYFIIRCAIDHNLRL